MIEEFQGRKRGARGPRREGLGRRYDASACGAERHANDGGTRHGHTGACSPGSHGHRMALALSCAHPSSATNSFIIHVALATKGNTIT